MGYATVKLPNNIVHIPLPALTATRQQNILECTRVLSDGDTRVTSDGSVRVIDDAIFSYPEVIAIKVPGHLLNVSAGA